MNILLLTGLYDTKPASGGSYLMQVYVEELRRQGHNVQVFYFTSADTDPRTAAKEADTWYLPDVRDSYLTNQPIYRKLINKVKGWLAGAPKQQDRLNRYFKRDFNWLKGTLDSVLKEKPIDIIQVDFPWMMSVANQLRKEIPKVFVSHEAQFVLCSREGNAALALRSKTLEGVLAARYNAILTLTDVEAQAWQQSVPALRVYHSPMGIELPGQTNNHVADKAHKLVFLGSGKHPPNLDGIRYFLLEIWPRIQAAYPQLEVEITGKYDEGFIKGFDSITGIKWVGFVPNLADFVYGAISIVPIRLGSGIRVKILESMAMGATVVATTMAAEGIGVKNGEEILLADDAESFAATIKHLYASGDEYKCIAKAAYKFVYENYELQISTQKRIALFESIIADATP